MKKLGLGLFLLLLVGCGGGTEQKHHHHKTDCTLTVYSETGDPIKSWGCKESEVMYKSNDIKFVDNPRQYSLDLGIFWNCNNGKRWKMI